MSQWDEPEKSSGCRCEPFLCKECRRTGYNPFVLNLSFIGWQILGSVTCGILEIFYVMPYVQATDEELYLALKK